MAIMQTLEVREDEESEEERDPDWASLPEEAIVSW